MGFPLLDLPNELIAQIIEHIDCHKTVGRLARTCRRLQYLAEPALYREVLIRTNSDALSAFLAFRNRRERYAAVHVLRLPCHASVRNFTDIATIMSELFNVKEILFESPACNELDFEDHRDWRRMAYPFFSPFRTASLLDDVVDLSCKPLRNLRKCKSVQFRREKFLRKDLNSNTHYTSRRFATSRR